MARYSAEHKAQSRNRLIAAAALLFRRHGFNGVGIDDLCAEADLTRGAFYGHFKSKAELLTAVLNGPHDFVKRLQARSDALDLREQAVAIAQGYLAPENRQAVLGGCSISALALDTLRNDPPAQEAYAIAVRQVIAELSREAPETDSDGATACAVLALCVGGLLVDNACGEDQIGRDVARAAQDEVERLLRQ